MRARTRPTRPTPRRLLLVLLWALLAIAVPSWANGVHSASSPPAIIAPLENDHSRSLTPTGDSSPPAKDTDKAELGSQTAPRTLLETAEMEKVRQTPDMGPMLSTELQKIHLGAHIRQQGYELGAKLDRVLGNMERIHNALMNHGTLPRKNPFGPPPGETYRPGLDIPKQVGEQWQPWHCCRICLNMPLPEIDSTFSEDERLAVDMPNSLQPSSKEVPALKTAPPPPPESSDNSAPSPSFLEELKQGRKRTNIWQTIEGAAQAGWEHLSSNVNTYASKVKETLLGDNPVVQQALQELNHPAPEKKEPKPPPTPQHGESKGRRGEYVPLDSTRVLFYPRLPRIRDIDRQDDSQPWGCCNICPDMSPPFFSAAAAVFLATNEAAARTGERSYTSAHAQDDASYAELPPGVANGWPMMQPFNIPPCCDFCMPRYFKQNPFSDAVQAPGTWSGTFLEEEAEESLGQHAEQHEHQNVAATKNDNNNNDEDEDFVDPSAFDKYQGISHKHSDSSEGSKHRFRRKGFLGNVVDSIKQGASNLWEKAKSVGSQVWEGVKNAGKNIVDSIATGIKGLFGGGQQTTNVVKTPIAQGTTAKLEKAPAIAGGLFNQPYPKPPPNQADPPPPPKPRKPQCCHRCMRKAPEENGRNLFSYWPRRKRQYK